MTPAEIKAAVVTLTGREAEAGVGGEIETMIQAATLRMHQTDFYARDLSESTINLGSEGFAFSFANTTFARFRALHYLRKSTVAGIAGDFLDPLDPLHLFNEYGIERNDVWYAAGANIVIRSSTAVQYLAAGWYQNPVISPFANLASWIADTVPHAIIFDACSLIFQMLAQQDQSRKFDNLVQEQLVQVRMHGIDAKGY